MKNFKPLGDFFSTTWNQFQKNWGNYVGLSAIFTIAQFVIIFVVVFALIFLQLAGIFGSIPFMASQDTTIAGVGGLLMITIIIATSFLLFLIIFGLSFLINSWLMSSLITLISKKPSSLDFVAFIKSCWPKVWKVFFAYILLMLIVFAGLICFIIPGIIFGLWLSQVLFLIILEDLSIGDAFKKSKELVSGHMGTIFLYNFVFMILAEIAIFAVNIIPFLGTLAMPIMTIVFVPLMVIFQYQIFLELKKLKG